MRSRGIEQDQVELAVDHRADRAAPAPQLVVVEMLVIELEAVGAEERPRLQRQVRKSTAPPRTRYRLSSIAAISGGVMSERNFGTCWSALLALADQVLAALQAA